MVSKKSLRINVKQIMALVERNLFLEIRFKSNVFSRYFSPFIQILMPLIIFNVIFAIREDYLFGYWTGLNYVLFLFIAFCIQFLRKIVLNFSHLFNKEKYWKTLQALTVAPINRYVLLFGFLIAEMILISIPFIFFFIMAYILFPISIINLFLVILSFLSISILFGCLGLILGILIITKEGLYSLINLALTFLFWLSCISYPLQIFPEIVQTVILFNPIYYFIDLIRIFWLMGIDYNLAITFLTPVHLIVVVGGTIILPIFSVYLFNTFYDKFGISGY
ncbi:MAG: ABC transporter permease [Candidatus Hermodarchaeota archaeon]